VAYGGFGPVSVRFPEMRARLREAIDSLVDEGLHERLWVRGERRSPSELGFADALLFVADEMEMFGDDDLVGDVLLNDSELIAFNDLVAAIHVVIEVIGSRGSFQDAQASGGTWTACAAKARELQVRMDAAGDHNA
jgi:hypothetical protein